MTRYPAVYKWTVRALRNGRGVGDSCGRGGRILGMVLGLAPVIGIPLPFMSYGGSSFMAFALMVAILVRLDAERFSVLR